MEGGRDARFDASLITEREQSGRGSELSSLSVASK